MASSLDSATALDDSPVSVAAGLTATLSAVAAATTTGSTVEGNGGADADVSQAVAALNSPITVGAQGNLQAGQTASALANATTVNGSNATATARFDDGSNSGGPVAGSFGGIVDTAASPLDLSIGAGGTVSVTVNDSATATAANTAGAATASALMPAVDGLYAVTAAVGSNGSIQSLVDAALTATASTVGASSSSGDATAEATAERLAAITADDPLNSDPSSLSFGGAGSVRAQAGTTTDPLRLTATAASIATSATASTDTALVAGITDQFSVGGSVSAGGPLAIEASGVVAQAAQATSTQSDATASGNADTVYGLQLGTISSGGNANVKAQAGARELASASSAAGTATANASLGSLEAALLSNTSIGGEGRLIASASADLQAQAISVTQNAEAASENIYLVAGLENTGPLSIGRDGQLQTSGQLNTGATATSVGGDATARANTGGGDIYGYADFQSFDNTAIGGSVQWLGSAATSLSATSRTVGSSASQADATSLVGGDPVANPLVNTTGIYFSALTLGGAASELTVGTDADFTGSANLNQTAQALTTQGNALAAALSGSTAAIDAEEVLRIGGKASIDATATQMATASATTVAGGSQAQQSSSNVAALYQGFGPTPLSAGKGIRITAAADSTGYAQASSVDAGSGKSADASVNQDKVYGVYFGESALEVGASATWLASANSMQRAQANNGGNPSASNDGKATAIVAESDQIAGVESADLTVGADLAAFSASARLDGQASSSNITATGLSRASAGSNGIGSGTVVHGLWDGNLSVGGSTLGPQGIAVTASGSLVAAASAVAGAAQARAGDSGAAVIGVGDDNILSQSSLSIGNQGRLLSQAQALVNADAASVAAPASASAEQASTGVLNTPMTVGGAGAVTAIANLSNTVLARSVLGAAQSNAGSQTIGSDQGSFNFGSNASLAFASGSQSQGLATSVAGAV